MGTYPPRECGLATFNQGLIKSSQKFLTDRVFCKVAAMNISLLDTYIYPSEVEWKIDQNNKKEYLDTAKIINDDKNIIGVFLQHEYGIYGGNDGVNILSFIYSCRKPIIVTLHTVLPEPTKHIRYVTGKIINRVNSIIVLTENSKRVLENIYPNSINKVHVIPHGIYETNFEESAGAKKILKLDNRIVLSTFGLLGRSKGIEFAIKALPKLIKKHPSVLYLVLGETHPMVRRSEGESYRNELSDLVKKLHLKNNVKFIDQYLSRKDLIQFLKATDIYISTSINPDQAVSGTLSDALGTGRAVVSTEFAQAKEIVTPDLGRLVPIMEPKAISSALIELLNDNKMLQIMNRIAYEKTRPMLWSNVSEGYLKLLVENTLPPINLTHLRNMTDEFGIFQFSEFGKPNKEYGYTLDDNARALVICSWLKHTDPKIDIDDLMIKYLNFIKYCQKPDGRFINYLDHLHKSETFQNDQEDLEDASARAMWALSEAIGNPLVSENIKSSAEKIFKRALPNIKDSEHLRSSALIIKSFSIAQKVFPDLSKKMIGIIRDKADLLTAEYHNNSVKSWRWFESYLIYNNAILPEALLIAGKITGENNYLNLGKESLTFLVNKTFSQNRYMPIGHSNWYKNKEKRSEFDQQPEDPASTVMALATAYDITQDERYRKLASVCFTWFLGNNSLGMPLYDHKNGGCYDGLHPDRINLNQGAESLISYLLARLALSKILV
ncbi:MAG: Alpha-glycosyltransferase-like protein, Glycosyltransferase family 4 [Candidatus Woesebacteria bacterium GW2011_GWB1_38_5]|uniref:Alpha-glycosyltransferase-like protein, Glycosyltransferase family 4 n=3 Tax=Candidatus Woeseibacteriota TaxID=1752722 RepID=A0A0G0K2U2_9BACT|nr:MAG: Alpha-glycosyltransferase-like protein, Glycosyltransferase family 4 [Candidatus Woesebacteria bacterium GW2011_GWD1_38_10]KKQ55362.1 MAG: Glycosyltransferase [Candidatus Woesebacteria bacterium GW2011_GWC1_38_13]KKQ74043.1 MAG: Alpha-glycosyltransferase-like protein, Glycosyltransferase family 4 [Candidatus Woesebacteria bacterium GW2011_GWB1_38_5]